MSAAKKKKSAEPKFNGPQEELVSAAMAMGATFVALFIFAALVHPQIVGGGPEAQPKPNLEGVKLQPIQ